MNILLGQLYLVMTKTETHINIVYDFITIVQTNIHLPEDSMQTWDDIIPFFSAIDMTAGAVTL